jgi:hypothetical protein
MNGMGKRARTLSGGQSMLAGVILALALAVTPVFFIVMFVTVNDLVGPYFDGWGWTVPVATEITFAMLFLTAVLFEWLRSPSHALWIAPYPFAGMSAFLNVWAAHGSVPGMGGHLAVTLAFFTPVTFAKMGVRRLMIGEEERARSVAKADARAHARDILRSSLGVWWRRRTPVLLRRQLRSGRLPALVMAAVGTGAATEWEPAVEAWVASAVALPERFSGTLAAARAEASATPLVTPSASVPQPLPPALPEAPASVSQETPVTPPGGLPAALPAAPPRPSPRPRRLVPARASDEDLAALLLPLLADGRDLSPTGVVKAVREAAGGKSGIGHERAGKVLALAREQAGRVVPIGERRQA